MNIVVIMTDSFRPDHVGAYGPTRCQTPSLDAFAQRATLFEKAYQATFPTVPTRADMFSGKCVFPELGWEPLPRDWPVLSQTLARHGYLTQMVIDTPHPIANGFFYQRGFHAYHWIRGQESDVLYADPDPEEVPLPAPGEIIRGLDVMRRGHYRSRLRWEHERDRFAPRTMSYAADWLERNHQRGPFFLYVDTFDPHEPWDAPPWYLDLYADPDFTGRAPDYPLYRAAAKYLTPDEVNHLDAMYSAEATMVDRWLGLLLGHLDRLGLSHDTAVFVMSDHGFYLGDHGFVGKLNMFRDEGGPWPKFDALARTTLLVRLPGQTAARRSSALVQPSDLASTICELAGIEAPATFTAPSYAPVLRGDAARVDGRDVVVTTDVLKPGSKAPNYLAVTDGQWTLNVSPGRPSYLHHTAADPDQEHNVLSEHGAEARRLFDSLVKLLGETGVDRDVIQVIREGVTL